MWGSDKPPTPRQEAIVLGLTQHCYHLSGLTLFPQSSTVSFAAPHAPWLCRPLAPCFPLPLRPHCVSGDELKTFHMVYMTLHLYFELVAELWLQPLPLNQLRYATIDRHSNDLQHMASPHRHCPSSSLP